MRDLEYVKATLAQPYETERPHELPYPDLEEVIEDTPFDYAAGTVGGERPNNSKSREGHDYLWFEHGPKSILSHRFIAAVTLGKWIPRDFDVDHVNHNPSDNRPTNLRIVTRRDNNGNRRKALLSELADLDTVAQSLAERAEVAAPEPEFHDGFGDDYDGSMDYVSAPKSIYTGETKPAKFGGVWRKTVQDSWHLCSNKKS